MSELPKETVVIDGHEYQLVKKEEEEKPGLLKVTNLVNIPENREIYINGNWAYSICPTEEEGQSYKGGVKSGHGSMIFLALCHGKWYDCNGKEISGYLFFKPKGE